YPGWAAAESGRPCDECRAGSGRILVAFANRPLRARSEGQRMACTARHLHTAARWQPGQNDGIAIQDGGRRQDQESAGRSTTGQSSRRVAAKTWCREWQNGEKVKMRAILAAGLGAILLASGAELAFHRRPVSRIFADSAIDQPPLSRKPIALALADNGTRLFV